MPVSSGASSHHSNEFCLVGWKSSNNGSDYCVFWEHLPFIRKSEISYHIPSTALHGPNHLRFPWEYAEQVGMVELPQHSRFKYLTWETFKGEQYPEYRILSTNLMQVVEINNIVPKSRSEGFEISPKMCSSAYFDYLNTI